MFADSLAVNLSTAKHARVALKIVAPVQSYVASMDVNLVKPAQPVHRIAVPVAVMAC